MVHGQAIGIPFRRRKGEQAPPPPKEVAWNQTIESNLPYKEVKYFKFVEGAGWQALNIGEILPVGQRVMIRIVTTEPYYEVSKAVSFQMTGIQIGKNGVSEYDIAGTLTGYSPQILTVTIGVDKNYVQWNPVVESNAEYQVVDFYIDTYPAVVGNYYLISSKLRVTITTKGAADEVTSLTVNGVSLGTPSINGNRFTFNGTLPDKSPQNINIAIDETGFPKSVRIVDGVNVLPASHNTLYSGSGRFCGFGNPGIGNSVTITQIPEYQNGFVFNGKTAYLENLNILAITDFTAIAKRVWANKDNPMNECFIHKGVVSTPISESAFMLEYEITNDTYYRSASFGGYINVERVNRPENITYQTTESYNGIPIIKGSGIDTKGLVIGAVTNNYWKGIFYKLMLYSKTIDMLSINALKNLFALDILIDINHPIFKK